MPENNESKDFDEEFEKALHFVGREALLIGKIIKNEVDEPGGLEIEFVDMRGKWTVVVNISAPYLTIVEKHD